MNCALSRSATAHRPKPRRSSSACAADARAALSAALRQRGMKRMVSGSALSAANGARSSASQERSTSRVVVSAVMGACKRLAGRYYRTHSDGVRQSRDRQRFTLSSGCSSLLSARISAGLHAPQVTHPRCAPAWPVRHAFLGLFTMHGSTGLYREAYERDSCGFGLIASLDDLPSHWLVQTAISSLNRLTHRGAVAADGKTGDGCGLLLKKPEGFLRALAAEAGIALAGPFASGLVFLSRAATQADAARAALAEQLAAQGLQVAGWREVPLDPQACGAEALKVLPRIEQVFVDTAGQDLDEAAFNRRLFVARRLAEKACAADPWFYVPSLSASTIVYKGMVMPQYLAEFYLDLADPRLEASVAVFHQRFSTNTLPQWRLAHPYRFVAHNGEINTIEGNRQWALARSSVLRSPLLPDLSDIMPLVTLTGSDSQSLDNMLEVLLMGGLDVPQALRLLIPPAWQAVDTLDSDLRAFYEFYSAHMEPWDGPAGVVLTDGRYAACALDRNGLRPARFVITKNRHLTIASEIGVWDYAPEDVVRKGKLGPGEIVALDLQTGTLLETRDVDAVLKARHPYKAWLKKGVRYLESDLIDPRLAAEPMDRETLAIFQKMFGVTAEERDEIIRVLAEDESEA